jgi:SAM-dependent methyltransferase
VTRRRKEWFDDDEFWQDISPFLFSEDRFAQAATDVQSLLTLAAPAGTAVLDLCCGPGRCAVPLALQGYAVTAVDRTKYFLDKAKARARSAGVSLELVQSDMRDFVRPAAFDLAISMFTSFGLFDDHDDDARVLGNLHASLRPGGALVIDLFGKEALARSFQPTTSTRLPNGNMLVERHEIIDDWTRVRNDWVVIRKGRAKNFSFHHTIYSGRELRSLLEAAGFVGVRLYGSLAGVPYGRDASRLVAVCHTPAGA